MQIKGSEIIGRGSSVNAQGVERCWLAMHATTFVDDNGKDHKYFHITRGDKIIPPDQKNPDAVIAIGFVGEGDEMKMLLTDEYRLPIGKTEIGSVAGLIDKEDYDAADGDSKKAAVLAAIREFRQETGMEFVPCQVSPTSLYCSAGMTDESVCLVIGKASGVPSKEFLEEHEQIDTMFLTRQEVTELMNRDDLAFSKHVWPFMWMVSQYGFPTL